MSAENEQNLLTKIILGTVTGDDFFAVTSDYNLIGDIFFKRPANDLLKGFNIVVGEQYNNSRHYHEIYISYNINSPEATIAIIENYDKSEYRVRCPRA